MDALPHEHSRVTDSEEKEIRQWVKVGLFVKKHWFIFSAVLGLFYGMWKSVQVIEAKMLVVEVKIASVETKVDKFDEKLDKAIRRNERNQYGSR